MASKVLVAMVKLYCFVLWGVCIQKDIHQKLDTKGYGGNP